MSPLSGDLAWCRWDAYYPGGIPFLVKLPALVTFALWTLSWPAPVSGARPGFESHNIVLYQPEDVLDARVGAVDDLARYIKQLRGVCTRYFAAADTPETLAVVVAIRPGRHAHVWFISSVRPGADPRRESLRHELEAVPPCEVRQGPVALAITATVAGGDGKDLTGDKGSKAIIPREWQDAANGKEGLLVPDGFLDLVWPDSAPFVPGVLPPAGTPFPSVPAANPERPVDLLPVIPTAKPTVYLHVIRAGDPQDQRMRKAYASKFTVADLQDSPAYIRPKPIAPNLPAVARTKSGEALPGDVVVLYVVTAEGSVIEPTILKSSDKRLNTTALKAMATWRFEPATLNGAPISVIVGQEFTFKKP